MGEYWKNGTLQKMQGFFLEFDEFSVNYHRGKLS